MYIFKPQKCHWFFICVAAVSVPGIGGGGGQMGAVTLLYTYHSQHIELKAWGSKGGVQYRDIVLYQYKEDEVIVSPLFFNNGNSYTGKTTPFI